MKSTTIISLVTLSLFVIAQLCCRTEDKKPKNQHPSFIMSMIML